MKMKMMILFVVLAAFAATAAFACPPCDEPWNGNGCNEQARYWYCCVYTDQCYVEDELFFGATADWQNASVTECQPAVAEPEQAVLPEALNEQPTEESATERS